MMVMISMMIMMITMTKMMLMTKLMQLVHKDDDCGYGGGDVGDFDDCFYLVRVTRYALAGMSH